MKFILFILLLLAYAWSSNPKKSEIQEMGKEKIIRGKDTIEVEVIMYSKGKYFVFEKKRKKFQT